MEISTIIIHKQTYFIIQLTHLQEGLTTFYVVITKLQRQKEMKPPHLSEGASPTAVAGLGEMPC